MQLLSIGALLGVFLVACANGDSNANASGGAASEGAGAHGGFGSAGGAGGIHQGGQGGQNPGGNGGESIGGNGGRNIGGSGGTNIGGNGGQNIGGSGGAGDCSLAPPPMGALVCDTENGSTAVTNGSGGNVFYCSRACTDTGGNSYVAECDDTQCECKYYVASSNGVTTGSTSGVGGGPPDTSTVCTCQLAAPICDAASFDSCCPAPWM